MGRKQLLNSVATVQVAFRDRVAVDQSCIHNRGNPDWRNQQAIEVVDDSKGYQPLGLALGKAVGPVGKCRGACL